MRTLIDFAIREEYSRVKALGDDLSDINSLIDWDRFRFLEPLIYKNKTSRGGRPNIDLVIMVKALVLQSWFGLSDPELERQVTDRISFRIFLGTTEVIPDFSTVWLFRERLMNAADTRIFGKSYRCSLMRKGLS
jgi:IS5 family transposase